jgi:hypothetical protein
MKMRLADGKRGFNYGGKVSNTIATVQPRYKNIIGNHLYILIREVFLYKGNSLFWLKKL